MIALMKQKTASRYFLGILSLVMLFVGTTAAFMIRKADFKGDWNFNESKSKVGESRFRRPPAKIKVSGEGESLTIDRTGTNQNGEAVTQSEKLTFDGKAAESTVFGSMKRSSVASWSASGEEMNINTTISGERNGQTFEVKISEVWKLTDGGKSLTIESTATSQQGTTNQTLVYDKN
jgi:hypothetical protein